MSSGNKSAIAPIVWKIVALVGEDVNMDVGVAEGLAMDAVVGSSVVVAAAVGAAVGESVVAFCVTAKVGLSVVSGRNSDEE
jgi:hypothetical protein